MRKYILPLLIAGTLSTTVQAQMDDKFYFPNKNRQPIEGLKFEEVTIPTDTVQLTGIFLKPEAKPKATILYFHGAGGNVSSYVPMTRQLVAAGYQVFMIDFRGYGYSTGKPTHMNIAQDGQVVLNYLLNRKDVKGTKVILYGASMGSQIATHLAKNNESKIAALVLDGALSSFTDLAADKSPEAQREMIRQYLTSPYAAKEDIKGIRNIPVLVVHSKEDKDVPFHQGEAVFINATGQKKFHIYEGKHLEALVTDTKNMINEIDQLITK